MNVENLVLGFVLGAAIIGFITLIVICVRLLYVLTETATIVKSTYISVNKIEQMSQATMQACENFVDALSDALKDQDSKVSPMSPMMFKMFSSEDGKHTAPTFDGLVEKMKKDPTYQQMSDNDIDELRKLFEDNSNDDDDDDDSDESNEPWKK